VKHVSDEFFGSNDYRNNFVDLLFNNVFLFTRGELETGFVYGLTIDLNEFFEL